MADPAPTWPEVCAVLARWVHELRLALDRPPAWKKLGELRAAMQPAALPTGARP